MRSLWSEEEVVAMARHELAELLKQRGGPPPVVQLYAERQHVRAVVEALRRDGRDVLTTDADVERWSGDAPGSPEAEYYPIITIRPRLARHSNGTEWWE